MKTSYFGKLEWLMSNGYKNIVAVSGYVPEFYQTLMNNHNCSSNIKFRRCLDLAPKKEWFWKWKQGEFDNEEYKRLYKETVLDKLNFDEIVSFLGKDAVLVCYEKSGDFCHRHLIAEWLESNGIECSEITGQSVSETLL